MTDIFIRFDGDIDAYARCCTSKQRQILNDNDFDRLSKIVETLRMSDLKNDTLFEFDKFYKDLQSECENKSVISSIEKYARKSKNKF